MRNLCDSFSSFECMDILLLNLIHVTIFVIYRPPPSQVNGLAVWLFFLEFSPFLENIVMLPETILILGDFNLHVDAADDVKCKRFLDLLLSFNLKQHVLCPTYNGPYSFDLQKKVRRRYERRWRSTGLPSDKQKFSKQCAVVNMMLFLSTQQYFNSVVADDENDQHSLFKTVFNVLYSKQNPQYPLSSDDTCLAKSFVHFFTDKIKSITQGVSSVRDTALSQLLDIITCSSAFCCFKGVSEDDVLRLIGSSVKSCSLDTTPASLLLKCLDSLLPTLSAYKAMHSTETALGNQQLVQSRQSLEQCLTDISSWMLPNIMV
ncbi:uncharacterized protein [Acropora muricata]|uniref:uncharacterized protein isoform X2 n=1 Tax=Acropora muricata TaxID=159855 RepID=UPI0034E391E6